MKFTRRGLFGMIAGAITGTVVVKAKPLIPVLSGGAALKYPVEKVICLTRRAS